MKFDKDLLIKHQFWIVVGVSVPLAAIALLLLLTSVSSSIEAKRKQLESELTSIKNAKDIKTEGDILEKKAVADKLVGHETDAWKKAYKEQESLFRWPRKMEAIYHFSDGLFATEVQIVKLPEDKKEWPKDDENKLLHGKLLKGANEQSFEIADREGKKHTFYVTPRLLKDGVANKEAEPPANIGFAKLGDFEGKYLAVTHQLTRYFNEKLTSDEQQDYKKTYHSQIPPILRQVDPLRIVIGEDNKSTVKGVVQLRAGAGWYFDLEESLKTDDDVPAKKKDVLLPPPGSKFLRYIAEDWNIKNDISEAAWIAQEDLWIQAEIYRLIRTANDSIAFFTELTKDTKPGMPVQYQNAYFKLTLQLAKDAKTLNLKIENRINRRQKLDGMNLRVTFAKGAEPIEIPVGGDPLEPYGTAGKDSRDLVINLPKQGKREHIYKVEQVLTWETAAVRRIDEIAIGSLATGEISFSHRTMPTGLRPLIKIDKPAETTGDKQGVSSFGGTGPPGAKPGGGAQPSANALVHGIVPERYQEITPEVTPQFRRIPVAIALIVNQNHVDRVQTAFNNSKLRFLMTQVLLNHYPNSLRPQVPGAGDKDSGDAATPGGGYPPGNAPPMPPPMGSGSFPGGGQGGAQLTAPVDEMEANMELVLYGVVTIYERFPPRATGPAPGVAAPAVP